MYIPMRRDFLYLVAIMDWHSRAVLSWRLSNTMTRYGMPEIFNPDQGSQFTSYEFTKALRDAGVRISMDGRGRWMDNVMIERLWRSMKYECVYLREPEMTCGRRWPGILTSTTSGNRMLLLTGISPWRYIEADPSQRRNPLWLGSTRRHERQPCPPKNRRQVVQHPERLSPVGLSMPKYSEGVSRGCMEDYLA